MCVFARFMSAVHIRRACQTPPPSSASRPRAAAGLRPAASRRAVAGSCRSVLRKLRRRVLVRRTRLSHPSCCQRRRRSFGEDDVDGDMVVHVSVQGLSAKKLRRRAKVSTKKMSTETSAKQMLIQKLRQMGRYRRSFSEEVDDEEASTKDAQSRRRQ